MKDPVHGPGLKYDEDKLRYDLIPARVLQWLARILSFGAKKYSANNWQKIEVDRYYAAMMRHVEAWRLGEWLDKESGYPHLAHALCCVVFMLWLGEEEEINNGDGTR